MICLGVIKKVWASGIGLTWTQDQEVYIGASNCKHMKDTHPIEYSKYSKFIPDIIKFPDYISLNTGDNSIRLIKRIGTPYENVLLAVRFTGNNRLFARSLYTVTETKISSYLNSGQTIKIP